MELILIGMAAITRVAQFTASVTVNYATMDRHLTDEIFSDPCCFNEQNLATTNEPKLHARIRHNYWCWVHSSNDSVIIRRSCLLGSTDGNRNFSII